MGEGDTMSKISFKANRNTVTANTYVAHALYVQNEAVITEMGGEIIRGAGTFKAEFPNAKLAKQFVEEKAVTHISKAEYNKARKTEPKTKVVAKSKPVSGKGKKADNEVITVGGKPYTLEETSDGFVLVPVVKGKSKSAPTPKKTVTKGKGKTATTKPVRAKANAPKKGKGKAFDFDFGKLEGKGTKYNSQASALIVKAGYKNGTPEYNAAWEIWKSVR